MYSHGVRGRVLEGLEGYAHTKRRKRFRFYAMGTMIIRSLSMTRKRVFTVLDTFIFFWYFPFLYVLTSECE